MGNKRHNDNVNVYLKRKYNVNDNVTAKEVENV